MPLHQTATRPVAIPVRFAIDHESEEPKLYDGFSLGEIVNSWDVVYVSAQTRADIARHWLEQDPDYAPIREYVNDILGRPPRDVPGAPVPVYDLVDYTTFLVE